MIDPDDVLERLRNNGHDGIFKTMNEAADEIVRLRAIVADLQQARRPWIVADWNTSHFYGPFASHNEAMDWLCSCLKLVRDGERLADVEYDQTEAGVVQLMTPELN